MVSAPLAFVVPVAVLLLTLTIAAAVMARSGWIGTLHRTGRLGIHSPAASASDEAFAVANRVAAPVLGGAAVLGAVLTVILAFLPLPAAATVVVGVVAVAAVATLFVAAGILGDRAARGIPVPARRPAANPACVGCGCGSGGCAGLTRKADHVAAEPA